MKFLPIGILAALFCAQAGAQNIVYSKPEFVNESVGVMDTTVRRSSFRGSATVARDPRLIYSCAHILYDRGVWASDYRFYRASHQRGFPPDSLESSPRGFHYLSRYASAARYTNGESNRSFAADFTVLYGPTSFGPAVPVQENSAPMLRTYTTYKRIVGYPADIDYTGERGYYYQHNTGWFAKRAFKIRGGFHDFFNVSTGPGNSGGALFLRDPVTGGDRFAGVLVAGGRNSAGVVAMTGATLRLSNAALGSATTELRTTNRNPIALGSSRPSVIRSLPMRDATGLVESLSLNVDLNGPETSGAKAWLQSPEGRVQRVSCDGTTDVSEAFRGSEVGGDWQLRIHAKDGSPVTFGSATLTAAVRAADGE